MAGHPRRRVQTTPLLHRLHLRDYQDATAEVGRGHIAGRIQRLAMSTVPAAKRQQVGRWVSEARHSVVTELPGVHFNHRAGGGDEWTLEEDRAELERLLHPSEYNVRITSIIQGEMARLDRLGAEVQRILNEMGRT
jgi:malonyl CoA-acyl carrier protein transacylase